MRAAKARWTDADVAGRQLQPFLRDFGLVAADDVLHANLPTQPPFGPLGRGALPNMATNIMRDPQDFAHEKGSAFLQLCFVLFS